MIRNITGIGEIVFDIIFKNNKPVEAKAGGSVFNMLVSLSRLGLPVFLVADMVDDVVGKILKQFMHSNNINTDYLYWHKEGRSRLALAFLNDQNDADYVFYKIQHEQIPRFDFPKPNNNDILIYGSYYAIKPSVRHIIEPYLDMCKASQMILLYDPNFRKNHLSMRDEVLPFIQKNISLSTVTKGSLEDFHYIFETTDISEITKKCLNFGCKTLIITRGSDSVIWIDKKNTCFYNVPSIKPISTIGAGDAFMAGIAYSICALKLNIYDFDAIPETIRNKIINIAILMSQMVCMSYENYISEQDVTEIRKQVNTI